MLKSDVTTAGNCGFKFQITAAQQSFTRLILKELLVQCMYYVCNHEIIDHDVVYNVPMLVHECLF